jgi:3D domain
MQAEAQLTGSASEPTFNLPEPATLRPETKRKLWATQYFVPSVKAIASGQPLLDMSGEPLGPQLSPADWCKCAIEGTMLVKTLDGKAKLFNFAVRGNQSQVNCRAVLNSNNLSTSINKSRFTLAGGPFGDGVRNLFLVPFRSIAIDKRQLNGLKFETAIFVPAARGTKLTLPSGREVVHDGYFFAADTGGMIKDNHIDVFTGIVTVANNPFPKFVKNDPNKTFDAFLITDATIVAALRRTHTTL